MFSSLLSTKTIIPPRGANRLDRPRLLQKLSDGVLQGKRLVLVCAPAGYGKTTLVAEWANRAAPLQVAWLACDPQDGDLARFLSYLAAALRRLDPRLGEGLLETFHASRLPNPETLATLLINDLARLPDRLVLVLDDFHTISSQPVHDFLAFLIEHQPPTLCLVLATRADPPLPLARWRARGQMDELRQNDLSFTREESADFLRQAMGVTLNLDQLQALERRTEGWAAGLQLAALSMRSTRDVSSFLEAFSGGDEYVADYLAGEALAGLPAPVQSFLLQTSILERLSAPLCAAVTGDPHSPEILEELREKNLFLVPLDHRREWYRYHTLFADLLRSRLLQSEPGQVDELYLRASRWCQENDLQVPSIEYALAGRAFETAAGLLEQTIEPVFISGQAVTLMRWLGMLPEGARDRHPILWIYSALIPIWIGKSSAAVSAFLPERALIFNREGLSGEAQAVQALAAMAGGRPAEAASLAGQALHALPEDRGLFRCLAADALGMANVLQSETAAAIQAFEQLAEMASRAGYGMFEIAALSHLAGLLLQQGRLNAAHAGYRRALELSVQKVGRCSPASGNILLGLGELARERDDLDAALRYFVEASEAFAQFSDLGVPVADLSIARVKADQGDWESAQEHLDNSRRAAQASGVTRMNDRLVDGVQTRFWISQGDLISAERWARKAALFDHPISEIVARAGLKAAGSEFIFTDYLNLARLYLAQEEPAAALQVIDPLLDVAHCMGFGRREVHALVLKAAALQQGKQTDRAADVLEQALDLAAPEGYIRVFLDEGEPMAQLLYRAVMRGHRPDTAKRVLAGFRPAVVSAAVPGEKLPNSARLLEPLSEREQEVLELIAAGLSNREIALRLHISLSTVKGHAANIYGKLGVNSRTQALSEAARLGILSR